MKPVVFGILMTLLVCAGLGWLWYSQQPLEPAAAPVVANQTADPSSDKQLHPILRDLPPTGATPKPSTDQPVPPTATRLPQLVAAPTDLGQSDEQTRAAVKDLSQHNMGTAEAKPAAQDLLQWLTPKEQIRKWVLLVDNVAMGKVPLKNRPLEFSIAAFSAAGPEQQPVLSESNFNRLNPLVDAFVSLDPDLLARYYSAWSPLLQEAFNELGQPGAFRDRLLEAIDRVLDVNPLEASPIALQRPSVYYRFADPEREAASDLEKLLWRMGPRNSVRIQSHLRDVRLALMQQP